MKRDYVSVVETAYSLEGDTEAWLGEVARVAGPLIDAGLGFTAYGFDYDESRGFAPSTKPVGVGPEGWFEAVSAMWEAFPPELGRQAFFTGNPVTTLSALVGPRGLATLDPALKKNCHPLGIRDFLGIRGINPRKSGIIVLASLRRKTRAAPRTVWLWNRIAAHWAAALRARETLASANSDVVATSDAVLSPGGEVLHAERTARANPSRRALTAAALAVERSRSSMRRVDPEGALDIWKGLVDGKWSILDHHDHDGRRFLLALRNDAKLTDPRALSRNERQVAVYAALGHSGKLIAYELGLAPQTVADHLRSAMRKLRVRSRSQLIRLFSGRDGV